MPTCPETALRGHAVNRAWPVRAVAMPPEPMLRVAAWPLRQWPCRPNFVLADKALVSACLQGKADGLCIREGAVRAVDRPRRYRTDAIKHADHRGRYDHRRRHIAANHDSRADKHAVAMPEVPIMMFPM